MENKQDLIDRKVDGLGKLWGYFLQKPVGFICFLSIMANIWLTHKLITTNERMSQAIIVEVKKQVAPEVKEQLKPTKASIDTVVNKVLDVINKQDDADKK